MTLVEARYFELECEGLQYAIQRAIDTPVRDDTWDGYVAYYGDVVGRAAWQARHVMRRARALGLLTGAAIETRIAAREKVQRQRERWSRAS
jgi:hypothetical protein